LTSLEQAIFVDTDATVSRLADDLRWLQPTNVIIDDAGRALHIVRELVRLRQTEPDFVKFRLIVVCWPDEVEALNDQVRDATIITLDLLERSELDRLLVLMGVTGQLARSEILDQAEGRAGWAVSLADTLIRSQDASSLLNGRALLGEVERYLRRASMSSDAVDVLATVAAVRSCSQREMEKISAALQISRPRLVSVLEGAARSGLVDVQSHYDWELKQSVRHFVIRPPMLADALATERAFFTEVPGLDLNALAESWPEKLVGITRTAIKSTRLGALEARPLAESLLATVLASDNSSYQGNLQLLREFAQLDRAAPQEVFRIVRSAFDDWLEEDERSPAEIEGLIELAALLAAWYSLDEAAVMLFDACLYDLRDTNPYPNHPLRKLADLLHDFHPELPHPRERRDFITRVLIDWLDQDMDDGHWHVFGQVIRPVLSLELRSAITTPGDRLQVQLLRTTVSADETHRIYDEIWPVLLSRLGLAPGTTLSAAIRAAEGWLRIGAGYDRAFGQAHSDDVVTAARTCGMQMFNDLVELAREHAALRAILLDVSERFSIPLELALDHPQAAFFADFERRPNWQAGMKELEDGIANDIEGWAQQDPEIIISRLKSLRSELDLANLKWPDRIQIAFQLLSKQVGNASVWLDVAVRHDFFPEAAPLLEPALDKGDLSLDKVGFLLESKGRWAVIGSVLSRDQSSPLLDLVIQSLTPREFGLMKTLVIQEKLEQELLSRLMTEPDPSTRGAVAAAMLIQAREAENAWPSVNLEDEWISAIQLFDPTTTPGFADYEAAELMKFLASRHPRTAKDWISRRLEVGFASGQVYGALPHAAWEEMHWLAPVWKEALWREFASRPGVKWLLGRSLVGRDIEWLRHAIEQDLIDPEEALGYYDDLETSPSMEDMAKLLVPRGVAPRQIASLARAGSWMGAQSDRYGKLKEDFEEIAKSPDASVKAVGDAGVAMFDQEMKAALAEEKTKRIRGEL
jgi:hypothetical protein